MQHPPPRLLPAAAESLSHVLDTLTLAGGGPSWFIRPTDLLRPGLETGDVVAWIDPVTRDPYGVVRVGTGNRTGGSGGPGGTSSTSESGVARSLLPGHQIRTHDAADSKSPPPAEPSDCAAFVLSRLDVASPGFRRGSCWLEVHRQGPHLGFRSAAAGGRFLQARRRRGGGLAAAANAVDASKGAAGAAPAADDAVQLGQMTAATAGIKSPPPVPRQQLQPSAAASACVPAGTDNGSVAVAAFAKQLARNSRLAFFSENLGVYEQFEVLGPTAAGGKMGSADDADADGSVEDPLRWPWQHTRVRLRSRLLPHIQVEVEVRVECVRL